MDVEQVKERHKRSEGSTMKAHLKEELVWKKPRSRVCNSEKKIGPKGEAMN